MKKCLLSLSALILCSCGGGGQTVIYVTSNGNGNNVSSSIYTVPGGYTQPAGAFPSAVIDNVMATAGVTNYYVPPITANSYSILENGQENGIVFVTIGCIFGDITSAQSAATAYVSTVQYSGYSVQTMNGYYSATKDRVGLIFGATEYNSQSMVVLQVQAQSSGGYSTYTYSTSTYTYSTNTGGNANAFPSTDIQSFMNARGIYSYYIPSFTAGSYQVSQGYQQGVYWCDIMGSNVTSDVLSTYYNAVAPYYTMSSQNDTQSNLTWYQAQASNYTLVFTQGYDNSGTPIFFLEIQVAG